MKTGTELIAAERQLQLKKGLEVNIIDNPNRELRKGVLALLTDNFAYFPDHWNTALCKKLFNKPYKERLIIAGAFIAAEIDRLQLNSKK